MTGLLEGLRVVEYASFVAGPSAGLHLAQMGADVIRVDPPGGAADIDRWPRTETGASLYWEGLNKGKRSVELDLRAPDGEAAFRRLVASGGENGGILVTNLPGSGALKYETLAAARPDLILVRIQGWHDGKPAVDYTVNAAAGYPLMTGPAALGDEPVNHVLPAWDLICGAYVAFTVVAAERRRRMTGKGAEIRVALGDIALATLGNMGQIAETLAAGGLDRARHGNALYGAFGRDFVTADGRRLMIVAITPRQWRDLLACLDLTDAVAALETDLGVSFGEDEGLRFVHRERLFPLFEERLAHMPSQEIIRRFEAANVCWGAYRTVAEALREDPRLSTANPLFRDVTHPSGLTYPTPGAVAVIVGEERHPPATAPRLGEHTGDVLGE